MTIHDLNGKTAAPAFWHAMPRKWNGDAYILGDAVQVTIGQEQRTLYLRDACSCTFAQFLTRWATIDGAPASQAAAWYAQWWQVNATDPIRVFLFSHTPAQQ